jgi:hypothetical protein
MILENGAHTHTHTYTHTHTHTHIYILEITELFYNFIVVKR